MIRRVSIETLAPTGEGVARSADGVGFVAGALPGEDVDADVLESRRRFWKGRAVAILRASPDRLTGGHADGCPACDWASLPLERAREWKRKLFLETMDRIGELSGEPFGALPIIPSPPGYRLRNRFHVSGKGGSSSVGFFAPRTHRVEPAAGCEALTDAMRALLPRLTEAVARSGAAVSEISTVEMPDSSRRLARATLADEEDRGAANSLLAAVAPLFDGVAVGSRAGTVLSRTGESRVWIPVEAREFPVTAGVFFQSNRHLLPELYADVKREAGSVPPGIALDAFGGVGLFAGALREAGHEVVTVEADHAAVELASEARKRWQASGWTIVHAAVHEFISRQGSAFDLVVVDPPRAGLSLRLVPALAERVGRRLVYVSCEPATLARDLAALTAAGLAIRAARLYDLFAFTHRVEAVVTLERPASR
jgi:tRNA/tmRNA/rRNA uracil-C5-methylase (TrmA/RlmC/RlmD family)